MNPAHSPRVAALAVVVLALVASASAAFARNVVRIPYKGPSQIEELVAHGVEIVAFTKYGVDVLADDKQLAFLQTRPYPVTVLSTGAEKAPAALPADLGLYHTVAEVGSLLTYWGTQYPAICQTFSIGTSIEGRAIRGVKISDNVTVDEDEPEVLYMGNHHARELMSVEIPLLFAQYLLTHYGSDPTVTNYVDTREIFIIPTVNPDGHVWVESHTSGSSVYWWRKNRRINADMSIGVDLNRNYGYEWGYDNVGSSPTPSSDIYRGTGPFSEPETAAIRAFVNSRHFSIWLSYHSYGELLLYPWGYIYGNTPDNQAYQALGDTLASGTGYLAGNAASGAIYITNGDSDDWGYGASGEHGKIFAFTPEVNSYDQGAFAPPDSLITPTFNLLLPMNLKVLEYAANPYRVLGPETPVQYAITQPWGNAVHRVSWSANDPNDPNPVAHYQVESCRNPSLLTDGGGMLSLYDVVGWMDTPSGHTLAGYYSGTGDDLSNTLTMDRPFFVGAASDTFSMWVEYDTEANWDYGYVEVSTDQGLSWTTVAGNITTSSNPNGTNRGYGFTGTSSWVYGIFPLTAYTGQEIMLRVSYITDASIHGNGVWVDDIHPVPVCGAVGVTDNVTGTSLDITPTTTGTFRYRVRGVDAESQASLWSNAEDFVVTTVSTADRPGRFGTALAPNVPNPFNPTTTIPFTVGGSSGGVTRPVNLAVYDVTGALVRVLVDEARSPGSYAVHWDGTDGWGHVSASGVYFVRLVVGTEVSTRKVALLK